MVSVVMWIYQRVLCIMMVESHCIPWSLTSVAWSPLFLYPLVIEQNYGKWPFLVEFCQVTWPFSSSLCNSHYQRVNPIQNPITSSFSNCFPMVFLWFSHGQTHQISWNPTVVPSSDCLLCHLQCLARHLRWLESGEFQGAVPGRVMGAMKSMVINGD